MKTNVVLCAGTWVLAVIVVAGCSALWAWPPVVHWSWSANECRSVEPPGAGSCSDLPTRYERVWVR